MRGSAITRRVALGIVTGNDMVQSFCANLFKVDGSREMVLRGAEGTLLLPLRQKTARWEHDPASQTTQPHTTAPIDFEKLQILEKCLGF